MRQNLIKFVILSFLIGIAISCTQKNGELPGFFVAHNPSQIGQKANDINTYHFDLTPARLNDTLIGYDLKSFIGINRNESLFEFDGFIYYHKACVYIIIDEKPSAVLFNFNIKEGESYSIPRQSDTLEIFLKKSYGLIRSYNSNVYQFQIKHIIPAGGHLPKGDMSLFVTPSHGIIGIYFSTIVPDEYNDGGKEIIFNIQGDILLGSVTYPNIILGGRF